MGAAADAEWEERVDPASGATYLFNARTGESAWKGDGDDWQELVDPASGVTYLHNARTGETAWKGGGSGSGRAQRAGSAEVRLSGLFGGASAASHAENPMHGGV